jgi:small conductance mechanosensitive channel
MEAFLPYIDQAGQWLLDYGPRFFYALLALWTGFKIINILTFSMGKVLEKQRIEVTLRRFLESIIGILLKVALFITIGYVLGVEMTSFVAILGAAGLAIGLALKDSLGNFAGGSFLVFFKPFRVGDVLDLDGILARVDRIQIFATRLKTLDNRVIIIPNGELANGRIINITAEKTRRVDMVFGISYEDDIDKAREVMQEVLDKNPLVLSDPVSQVKLFELGDSSVNFLVRPWCNTTDYLDVQCQVTEGIKKAFDKAGISIPYPQRDLHVYRHDILEGMNA